MKSFTIIIIISCLSFSYPLFTQDAPDFTITDTHGVEHNLYEDYLDQGKTVLIDFFFVNCPPCQSFAPTLQGLYEHWGAGQEDVQFFSFSTKSGDTNFHVLGFENNYGLTFPAAGSDGGGLDAASPYINGMFGTFWGTPSIAVISPDGSVNYNVGTNPDNINSAIAATGATGGMEVSPEPITIQISIKDQYGQTIPGVSLALASSAFGSNSFDISTDDQGQIIIEDFENTFGLSDPVIKPSKNDNHKAGITTLDITLSLRHILGIDEFDTEYPLFAADVSGDGKLSAFDLVLTRQIILGIIDEFPNVEAWKFIPESLPIEIEPGSVNQLEFIGVKMGDTSF